MKGIVHLQEIVPKQCDANISFDRKFLIQWVFGETTIKEALESKGVKYGGDKDQIIEFFENLSSKQFMLVQEFFETMPKLSHTIKVTNPNTKVESDVVLEGLASFFA